MSNGFYFVPQTLYDLLEQQAKRDAQGDVRETLKKIVEDFIARNDTDLLLAAYNEPQPYDPKVMSGDDYDYPTFWRHVDKVGRESSTRANRDTVMAAALQHHFAQAARKPAAGPDANAMTDGLPVPIEQSLYARLRSQSLKTGTSISDQITAALTRYLDAPSAYQKPLRYAVGTRLTVFTYHLPDAALLARIDDALGAHNAPMQRVDRRDVVAVAIDADFKRLDAAAANNTPAARMARLRPDRRFKL